MFESPRQIKSAVVGADNFPVGVAPLAQIDFNKIWSVLWRGRATILSTTVAALVLAILFVVLAPHEYTAVTQILIDPSDLRAVGNDTTRPAQMSDATGSPQAGKRITQFSSRHVDHANRAIEQ